MNDETIIEYAKAYAEAGINVLFVKPDKHPYIGAPIHIGGADSATTDATKIDHWRALAEQHAVEPSLAIVAKGDLCLIDIDVKGGVDGWETFRALEAKLGELPETVCYTTPSGGHHFILRIPEGVSAANIPEGATGGVGIRINNQYVVTAPSPGYEFDVDPNDIEWAIPDIPAAWVDHFAATKETTKPAYSEMGAISEGGRNAALTSYAGALRNLGSSEAEILAALEQRNIERCAPRLESRELAAIARSIMRYPEDQVATAMAEGVDSVAAFAPPKQTDPGVFPPELLNPGGLLQLMHDYTLSQSKYPMPNLSIMCMLTTLSAVCGNRVFVAETEANTNIYALAKAPTASGKNRARQMAEKMLRAAELDHLRGEESFTSESSINTMLDAHNTRVSYVDEVGRYLQGTKSKGASSFQTAVVTAFLKIFSVHAGEIYKPIGYANRELNKIINSPCFSMYMTGTERDLTDGITTADILNGLLPRMLYVETGYVDRQTVKMRDVPDAIIKGMKQIQAVQPQVTLKPGFPVAMVPEAYDCLEAFTDECEGIARADGEISAAFFGRAHQIAERLALIHAMSLWAAHGGAMAVSLKSMEYAINLSRWSAYAWIDFAERSISDSGVEKDKKRIIEFIRESKTDGVRFSALSHARGLRHLKRRERLELVEDLIGSGDIVDREKKTDGRSARVLVWGGFASEVPANV